MRYHWLSNHSYKSITERIKENLTICAFAEKGLVYHQVEGLLLAFNLSLQTVHKKNQQNLAIDAAEYRAGTQQSSPSLRCCHWSAKPEGPRSPCLRPSSSTSCLLCCRGCCSASCWALCLLSWGSTFWKLAKAPGWQVSSLQPCLCVCVCVSVCVCLYLCVYLKASCQATDASDDKYNPYSFAYKSALSAERGQYLLGAGQGARVAGHFMLSGMCIERSCIRVY